MFLEVTQAKYLNGYRILLAFNDGVTKIVDLQNELNGKIFEPLKDIQSFKKFVIKFNTIEWYNGADFAPEYLYQIGVTKEIAAKEVIV
jgi:hypothetical protein